MDSREFRSICGQFATGVAVVTGLDHDGKPVGLTINSFSSVSLEPALVSFCLDFNVMSLEAFKSGPGFAIHFLAYDQMELSNKFAKAGVDKFSGVDWTPGLNGVPLLDGAIARMQCERHAMVEAGDHIIFIGAVKDADSPRNDAEPLLYFRGGYGAMKI